MEEKMHANVCRQSTVKCVRTAYRMGRERWDRRHVKLDHKGCWIPIKCLYFLIRTMRGPVWSTDWQLHHYWELVRSGIKVPTQNYWINICVSTVTWGVCTQKFELFFILGALSSLFHLTSSYSPKFPKWPSGDNLLGHLFYSQIPDHSLDLLLL